MRTTVLPPLPLAVRSFIPNLFLVILIPAVLVFLIGITRLGLQGQKIGGAEERREQNSGDPVVIVVTTWPFLAIVPAVGNAANLDLSLSRFVNNSSPLVWADETTSSSGLNASQVIASLPGLPLSAVIYVSNGSNVASICSKRACFAGVVFSDSGISGVERSYTLLYPGNLVSACPVV